MRTTWGSGIAGRDDIEQHIGQLRHLFFTGSRDDWGFTFCAWISLTITVILLGCLLIFPNLQNDWWFWSYSSLSALVTLVFWSRNWWRRRKRKYFAVCEEGCAYGWQAANRPVIIPWSELQSIQVLEDSSLRVDKSKAWGVTVSTTMHEITTRLLVLSGGSEEIRLKLGEFPETKKLLDVLMDHTQGRGVELDYSRKESSELIAAKQKGQDVKFGKQQMTIFGVVLFVIFLIIKFMFVFNKR